MRAAGITQQIGRGDVEDITGLMRLFLKNRWIGLWPILYGRQVRQTALDDWIFQGIFDIEHVPEVDDSKNKSEAKR
jgi:glycerol-3-phosphate dehydrogenase